MASVNFIIATRAQFDGITPDADTFYRVINTDSSEDLYKGNLKLNNTKATEISILDSADHFTSTTVEGALAELAEASSADASSKTVYLRDESASQTTYAKVYKLYQGSNTTDMTQNTLVGTINMPKDLVVQSGKIVTVTSGVDSDGDSTTVADGTYIKLVVQNQTEPIYINVADLIDAYTGGATAEATVSISASNVVTVTINKILSTKVVYKEAEGVDPEITVKAALDDVYTHLTWRNLV